MNLEIKELQLKQESVKRCVLESNQGEVLNYKPNNQYNFQNKIIRAFDNMCSIRMYSINNSHAGVWKITAYVVQNKSIDVTSSPYNDGVTSREEVFVFHLHTVQVNLALYRRFFFPFFFSLFFFFFLSI